MLWLELSPPLGQSDIDGREYLGTVRKNVLKNKLYMRKQTMKKRIISLILVVAMAFLTLTGCAYNYAKDDMSKYATLDYQKFYDALQALVIEDGTFGTEDEGENGRKVKVQDAIAAAILKVTDAADKVFAGKVEKYDALYFCYYATDADGNVFYASKMDESKPTNIQVGLSSLEDLNKAISDGVLTVEDIASHIYSTSAASVVGKGDVLSISYVKTWGEDGKETKSNAYFVVGDNNAFAEALIGAQVGVTLDEIKVTEKIDENDVECTYTDVKVESIVKDNSTVKVADGDKVYLTYTYTFKATKNEETNEFEVPEGFDKTKIDAEGNYKATVSYELNTIVADPENATAEQKTFLGQLVGKTAGSTTSSISVKNGGKFDSALEGVEVKFTNVKVNWIVNSDTEGFEVKYTPYEEEYDEEKKNEKTETNVYGEKIRLNAKELTYHIFPVYYLDVADVSAELIIREFYSTVASTEVAEHDETEEGHDHEALTSYVFDTLNDKEFKNGDKTLADLVKELVTLNSTLTTKEKTLTDALKALSTAQSNLAKDDGKSDTETSSLNTKLQNAEKAYATAKSDVEKAEKDVEEKITAILACKKGETGIEAGIVADYETYHYDTLEEAYKSDIKTKLATKVIEYLNKNTTFGGELPKKAVKNAYKAIMNTYKNDFYEGDYKSSSTSTSTSTETNYKHYNGDFDSYLLDKVVSNKGTMEDVEKSIQAEAEQTVKDIILIYVFTEAVENKWSTELSLTKDEKKEIKKNLENTALLYQQYGLSFSYNVEDSYHAEQFDKAMNYLLEEKETEGNAVEYEHIKYSTEAEDK